MKAKSIYKCPEEAAQAKKNAIKKVRSYAMNAYIGPRPDTDFTVSPLYKAFFKDSDVGRPSDIFLMMDENADTLCMPHFRVLMDGQSWFHAPSALHSGSGVM